MSASDGFLDRLPVGLLLLDVEGRVIRANDEAARLIGDNARSIEGRSVYEAVAAFGLAEGDHRELLRSVGQREWRHTHQAKGTRMHLRAVAPARGRIAGFVMLDATPGIDGVDALSSGLDRALAVATTARHEINNALMGIMGQVELLEMRTDLDEAARRRLAAISSEVAKIRAEVARLRTLREG